MHRRVACFVMPDANHFHGVLPVIAELVRAGAEVCVWTDRGFAAEVIATGAEFADLFAAFTLDDVDNQSRPLPMRYVAFAAAAADVLAQQVNAWGATLVVHGEFALVGRVVAERLSLTRVLIYSGHAVEGSVFRARLKADKRVSISPACVAAVERLRDEFGMADASPFSYVPDPSPWLNIYLEPEEWLSPELRARKGPIAYFGSLAGPLPRASRPRPAGNGSLRVYASLGVIMWRYWPNEGAASLLAIAEAVSGFPGAELVFGLGGAQIDSAVRTALEQSGARVEAYADQWAELGAADLVITHCGMNSVHEAVACGVPMLAYPIFWDQPALAARCREFGLALPLVDETGPLPGQLDPAVVAETIIRAIDKRPAMLERLVEAQDWERRTIAARPAVARQILALD